MKYEDVKVGQCVSFKGTLYNPEFFGYKIRAVVLYKLPSHGKIVVQIVDMVQEKYNRYEFYPTMQLTAGDLKFEGHSLIKTSTPVVAMNVEEARALTKYVVFLNGLDIEKFKYPIYFAAYPGDYPMDKDGTVSDVIENYDESMMEYPGSYEPLKLRYNLETNQIEYFVHSPVMCVDGKLCKVSLIEALKGTYPAEYEN